MTKDWSDGLRRTSVGLRPETDRVQLDSNDLRRTSDGLLRVQPVFRSPTGFLPYPIGLRRTSGGVRRTSDTILRLKLTILGIKALFEVRVAL